MLVACACTSRKSIISRSFVVAPFRPTLPKLPPHSKALLYSNQQPPAFAPDFSQVFIASRSKNIGDRFFRSFENLRGGFAQLTAYCARLSVRVGLGVTVAVKIIQPARLSPHYVLCRVTDREFKSLTSSFLAKNFHIDKPLLNALFNTVQLYD